MKDIDKDLARILGAYEAAVFAKDVDGFMRLYSPDVRIFDAWGVWLYNGAEPWRRAVEGWLGSLGSERVRVSFEEVMSLSGRDLSSVNAIVTYAALSAEGVEVRAMQNRITWVFRTVGDVPRIIHEHTSAPIGFEDMKAILVRNKAT
jgi:ketosteroid isomerase-like protein